MLFLSCNFVFLFFLREHLYVKWSRQLPDQGILEQFQLDSIESFLQIRIDDQGIIV